MHASRVHVEVRSFLCRELWAIDSDDCDLTAHRSLRLSTGCISQRYIYSYSSTRLLHGVRDRVATDPKPCLDRATARRATSVSVARARSSTGNSFVFILQCLYALNRIFQQEVVDVVLFLVDAHDSEFIPCVRTSAWPLQTMLDAPLLAGTSAFIQHNLS